MGQAAIVLLVGTLIGFGGVADDPGVDTEDAIQVDDGAVQAADGAARAQADASGAPSTGASVGSGASASVDAGLASASVDATGTAQPVLDRMREIPIEIPHLPTDPSLLPVTVDASQDRKPAKAPAGHLALAGAQAAEQPSSSPVSDAIGAHLVPAAAAAALAALHVEPSLRGWRRLVPIAPAVGMYSRIPRDEVLEHDTREAVYELLQDQPGLSLQAIARELDASRSTIRHHVRVLEDNEMVSHAARGRSRIHYPVGREVEAVRNHLLANENRARIVAMLEDEPRSLTELADVLDENAGAVHFHLDKLCEAGLVERRENGSVTYQAAKAAVHDGVTFEPVDG